MNSDKIEEYAKRIALGNNGGDWAIHYSEKNKEFWRNLVKDLIKDIGLQ